MGEIRVSWRKGRDVGETIGSIKVHTKMERDRREEEEIDGMLDDLGLNGWYLHLFSCYLHLVTMTLRVVCWFQPMDCVGYAMLQYVRIGRELMVAAKGKWLVEVPPRRGPSRIQR